jgi:hypothetical protein
MDGEEWKEDTSITREDAVKYIATKARLLIQAPELAVPAEVLITAISPNREYVKLCIGGMGGLLPSSGVWLPISSVHVLDMFESLPLPRRALFGGE